MDILRIAGFDRDVSLTAADSKQFLAAQNIRITFHQVSNSTEEISGLLEGAWDVAFDNGDNVVAWDEGMGADGKPHDLFIFMGGPSELTQDLFVTADITKLEDLRGKTLGADAVGTGFAVVLRYILQSHDLSCERDYRFDAVGSTRMRLAALRARRISGAMLNPRYVEESGATDLRLLARGRDYAHPYPARIGLATRTWAASHRSLLVRFIAAMIRTMEWVLEPQNKAELIGLMKSALKRGESQAERDYRRLFEPQSGLVTRGAFSPESLRTVLDIRRKLGLIGSPLPPLEKFHDDTFYREAVQSLEKG